MTISKLHTFDLEEITKLLEQHNYKDEKVIKFTKQLWEACSKSGFFYIKNHGIEQKQIGTLFSYSKEFFSEPLEVKQRYSDIESSGSLGYSQIGNERLSESLPDQKEILNFRINKLNSMHVPEVFDKNKEYVKDFLRKTWKASKTLLVGLALTLGLSPDFFYKAHDEELESGSYYRLIHYPPVENGDKDIIRAGRHSDYGSLILLFLETSSYEKLQTSSGLQVFTEERDVFGNEIWTDVLARENCIIVNVGDLLSFWTEGRFRSSIHRVVVPKGETAKKSRYIFTHFIHPNENHSIYPIKSSIPAPYPKEEISPGAYKASIGSREFFYGDTADTYV